MCSNKRQLIGYRCTSFRICELTLTRTYSNDAPIHCAHLRSDSCNIARNRALQGHGRKEIEEHTAAAVCTGMALLYLMIYNQSV